MVVLAAHPDVNGSAEAVGDSKLHESFAVASFAKVASSREQMVSSRS